MDKEQMMNVLRRVVDPELGISIVDLGLIYELKLGREGRVLVVMTLTTPGCPLAGFLEEQVRETLLAGGDGVREVKVEITFDPPWNQEMMSVEARQQLGLE